MHWALLLLAAPWTYWSAPEDEMGRPATHYFCVKSDDRSSELCISKSEKILLFLSTNLPWSYRPGRYAEVLVRLDDEKARWHRVGVLDRRGASDMMFARSEHENQILQALLRGPTRLRVEVILTDETRHVITFHTSEAP